MRSSGRLTCLAAVVLVGGVLAAVDPWGLRPYTTARWVVVGVAAATAAATVRWRPPRGVGLVGAGLLGSIVIASVTALDPLTALVGHPRRHLGLAGWVVCGLALLAGTGLGEREPRRWIGRAVAAGGVVTGATVVADVVGWDPFGTSFAEGRVGGLLGQPLYLAVAALLVGPVAGGVAVDRGERRTWRVIGAVGCAGAVLALAASQTRGAWLGALVAGALVLVTRHDGRRPPGRGADGRRRAMTSIAVVVAVAAVLVVGVPRMADLADTGDPGGFGRLDEWRVAVGVIGDDPLTGVGPEGYRIAAPAHIDDDYTRRHGRDEVVDRAHSGPLDVAASAGVPAALLYVGLVGVVVVRCTRLVGRSADPVLVGAASGVVAWSVQQLVGFPIAEVDPLAWLLAGMVVVAAPARSPDPPGSRDPRSGRRSRVQAALVGAGAVLLGVAGLRAVSADRALARADDARDRGDVAAALASADRATDLRPDDVDAWYLAARIAATPAGLPAVDNGLDRVEAGLDRIPGDPALRHFHTALLAERGQRSGLPDDLADAEAAARALIADDPSSPAAHRALGLTLAAGGHTADARAALARAVALDPDDEAAVAALARLDDGANGASG